MLIHYSFCVLTAKYPKLWEDKLLAGFMPLKASLSTEDTFAIQDAPQLSSEVRKWLDSLKSVGMCISVNHSKHLEGVVFMLCYCGWPNTCNNDDC